MTASSGRALRMSYLVASVAGVAFFVMSVALLAIWPGRVLGRQSQLMSPEHPLGMTAAELRGRAVYGHEGCAYCHSQQIRYLRADIMRFGAPTLAWETWQDYPHLWGTRRIGPDLARESGTRTDDWQYAHLFEPRLVVRDSVMPAYTQLFEGSPLRPRQSARDLVAYLGTLGRARELAGPEGEARGKSACNCLDDEMVQMAFSAPELNANPARTRRSTEAPTLPASGADPSRGRALYAANCASCHGEGGIGDGPGASALLPRPANLSEHEYTMMRLADALWNGVAGTAMQAWRDHTPQDLAAMANVVRSFSRQERPSLPENLVALGQRVYTANCVQCHGLEGRGDGTAASELSIAPTNFHRQQPTLGHSLQVLRSGIPGTRMGPWTDRLSEAEIMAVANFVRLYFEPDAGGAGR